MDRIAGFRSRLCCFCLALGKLLSFPVISASVTGLVLEKEECLAESRNWESVPAIPQSAKWAHTALQRPSGPEGRRMTVAVEG